MDLYTTLFTDHQRLDGLFESLLNCVHANDAEAAQAAWTEFDRGLAAHLDAEEASVLPLFERMDPAEAERIRAEHGRIRDLLAELGVMLDLHALREEKVAEFIDFLRAHAAREESALYPWAERELPEATKSLVSRRLHGEQRSPCAEAQGARPAGPIAPGKTDLPR